MNRRAPASAPPGSPVRVLAVNVLTCTGMVVSAALPSPVLAVSLGAIEVRSSIGQPLRASVPAQLAPDEYFAAQCLQANTPDEAALTPVPSPQFALAQSAPELRSIEITTSSALFEPMYELQLQVKCQGTAVLVRRYVLMLDLPAVAPARTAVATSATTQPSVDLQNPQPAAAAFVPVVTASAQSGGEGFAERSTARPRHVRVSSPRGAAITPGVSYRVKRGDTLWGISSRIAGRGAGSLWHVADQILAANPQAFNQGNPDQLRLGAQLFIPGNAEPGSGETAATQAASTATPSITDRGPARVNDSFSTAASGTPEAASRPTPVETPDENMAADEAPVTTAPTASSPAPVAAPVAEPPAATPVVTAAPAQAPPLAAKAQLPSPPAVVAPASASNTLQAILLGAFVGFLISLVLLRERFLNMLQSLRGRGAAREVVAVTAPDEVRRQSRLDASRAAPAAVSVTRPPPPASKLRESSMVVEESDGDLLSDVVTRQLPRASAATAAVRAPLPPVEAGPDDSTLARPVEVQTLNQIFDEEFPLDMDVEFADDLTARESIDFAPTVEDLALDLDQLRTVRSVQDGGWTDAPATPSLGGEVSDTERTGESTDLHTLAALGPDNERTSRTLMDALTLLEKDYEAELTASQLVDLTKLTEQAGLDNINDSQVIRTGTDAHNKRK